MQYGAESKRMKLHVPLTSQGAARAGSPTSAPAMAAASELLYLSALLTMVLGVHWRRPLDPRLRRPNPYAQPPDPRRGRGEEPSGPPDPCQKDSPVAPRGRI
jgi:hypothetical protein